MRNTIFIYLLNCIGIGKLVLKDQHQFVLKYQQATPLDSAGMPLWLGLKLKSPIPRAYKWPSTKFLDSNCTCSHAAYREKQRLLFTDVFLIYNTFSRSRGHWKNTQLHSNPWGLGLPYTLSIYNNKWKHFSKYTFRINVHFTELSAQLICIVG